MSATFTCEPGYSLSGHSMVSCLPEGKGWNYEFPICSEYLFSCEVYHQKNADVLSILTASLYLPWYIFDASIMSFIQYAHI